MLAVRGFAALAVGVGLTVYAASARADECAGMKTVGEIYAALNSKDAVTVLKAQKCGLLSPDRAAKGLIIARYLSDGRSINIGIQNYPGDKAAAEFLPKLPLFSIQNLAWSKNDHAFTGNDSSNNLATGNLIEDKLTLSYYNIIISGEKPGQVVTECQAELSLNSKGTELEGPLMCQGIPLRFKAFIGF